MKSMRRATSVVLCLILAMTMVSPVFAVGTKPSLQQKKIRVGWFDSTFNFKDDHGRRFGYSYDYQQKIAAYTGWEYEYVEGSWPELLEMLEKGEIDLLSDVSYTKERAKQMLFSTNAMGTESYYTFVSRDNKEIDPEDLTTFNGKSISVNKDSVTAACLRKWAKDHGIKPKILETTDTKEKQQKMLMDGKIDALTSPDIYSGEKGFVPVAKVGASEFYFVVATGRKDLLEQLDAAMERILEEDRYYNQELWDKYFNNSDASAYLTTGEKKWLAEHGAIRVGYRDNYLPFCKSTGKGAMTGALQECLTMAASETENADLKFMTVPYANTREALEALKRGEVDCVFPSSLTASDGEEAGFVMTKPLVQTEMYAIVRKKDKYRVLPRTGIKVAVNSDNPNQRVFVETEFPEWELLPIDGEKACRTAVEEGEADLTLVSQYRALRRDDLKESDELETVLTGKFMPQGFALDRESSDCYAILEKTVCRLPATAIEAAIEPYAYSEEKVSVKAFLRDYWAAVLIIATAVFVLLLFLLVTRMKSEQKAHEREKLIAATERDRLTGLYNRNFFFEYVTRRYLDAPHRPMDSIVIDIDQFHTVNALTGRDFGDRVLQLLGDEIRAFVEETKGIGGRLEADHFAICCRHTEDHQGLFDRLQGKLDSLEKGAGIRLRMGVMPWQENEDPIQLFDQARVACNLAKGDYRNRLVVFDEEVRQREIYEQRLLNDLNRALEEKEFLVYYQPKYYIQGEAPRLSSAEALIRWNHPSLGMIPPGDFIPLFEAHGQITAIDKYVWAEAARQIAAWRDAYGVVVPVSVNLSRVDVFDPALEETLEGLLESNGLSREAFKLEVTESAYTENADQVIRVIEGLRAKGYEIEMDDFGSGYSSLNMLSSMPVDVLKMDRCFIRNIEQSEEDLRLVELILDIARNLRVPVIAEGVETEGQMLLLKDLGCDVIQGYYFSRPLPAEEFEKKIVAKEG